MRFQDVLTLFAAERLLGPPGYCAELWSNDIHPNGSGLHRDADRAWHTVCRNSD